jgi:hypothetical protein
MQHDRSMVYCGRRGSCKARRLETHLEIVAQSRGRLSLCENEITRPRVYVILILLQSPRRLTKRPDEESRSFDRPIN